MLKDGLKEGDHVEFYPTHNKGLKLTGSIIKIHSGADDVVDIECDVDGKNVEVEGHIQTAHAEDVKVLEAAKGGRRSKKEKEED